jgi:hypothetical protein
LDFVMPGRGVQLAVGVRIGLHHLLEVFIDGGDLLGAVHRSGGNGRRGRQEREQDAEFWQMHGQMNHPILYYKPCFPWGNGRKSGSSGGHFPLLSSEFPSEESAVNKLYDFALAKLSTGHERKSRK